MERLIVLDRNMTPLGEIQDVSNLAVSWLLNKAAAATFDITWNHPKAQRLLLQKGNYLQIRSDKLPDWFGIIDDRHWHGDLLTVSASDSLQRLRWRFTRPAKLLGLPAGGHFAHLLHEANAIAQTGLVVGTVFNGGPPLDITYTAGELTYNKVQSLLDQVKYDIQLQLITPGVMAVNLVERLGVDRTQQVIVIVGVDTEQDPEYEEDDKEYANDITEGGRKVGTGGSSVSPEQEWADRPKGRWSDPAEIGTYGLAEAFIDDLDISDQNALNTKARTDGHIRVLPKRPIVLHLNNRRGWWGTFVPGDVLCVQAPHFSYSGIAVPFRVLGMELAAATSSLNLIGEVVAGDDAANLAMFTSFQYGGSLGHISELGVESGN